MKRKILKLATLTDILLLFCLVIASLTSGAAAQKVSQSGKREGLCSPEPLHVPIPEIWNKFSGILRLQIIIDKNGDVSSVDLETPSREAGVNSQVVETVKNWKFDPALKDSKPMAVRYQLFLEYRRDSVLLKLPKLQQYRGCDKMEIRY